MSRTEWGDARDVKKIIGSHGSLLHRRGQGTGLGIPGKEEEATNPLEWEGDAPGHNSVGSVEG